MTTAPPGAPPAALLAVRDLGISTGGVGLVRGVSFDVRAGQRVGIIGASGSGKTLTALAVAGLLPSELSATGSIRLAGFAPDVLRAGERALAKVRGRLTGVVFQEPMTALNPTMRAGRQVAGAIRVHRPRTSRSAAAAEARSLLASAGLDDPARIAGSYPHQLSGGQRQRVVLAIAVANDPGILICDEPTTALDVSMQARVLDLIDRRITQTGAALLFISHDLAVVAAVCDELLVMWRGRIVERGPLVSVLADPQHEHTRQLLADADLAPRGLPARGDAT